MQLTPFNLRRITTPGERSFWYMRGTDLTRPSHGVRRIRLSGTLDLQLLFEAVKVFVASEPGLRSVFRETHKTQPSKRYDCLDAFTSYYSPVPSFEDLSSASLEERAIALAGIDRDLSDFKFDMQHGPLIQFAVAKEASDSHVLYVCIHHLVSDLTTLRSLMQRLGNVYSVICNQKPQPVLPLIGKPGYLDYASWSFVKFDNSERYNRGIRYWQSRRPALTKYPLLRIEGQCEISKSVTGAALHRFSIPIQLSKSRAHTGQYDISLPVVAFAVCLCFLERMREVTLFIYQSLRYDPSFASVLGVCVNIVPVAIACEWGETVNAAIDQFDDGHCRDLLYSYVSTPDIMGHTEGQMNLEDGLSRIAFNFFGRLPDGPNQIDFEGMRVSELASLDHGSFRREFEISFSVSYDAEYVYVQFWYWRSLYSDNFAHKFSRLYTDVLQEIAANANSRLQDLESLKRW